jgi:hypothetical protein
MRDQDAWFAEHHTDAELERMEALGLNRHCGIVRCEECESTGVVSELRRDELMAEARAHVERIIAEYEDRQRRG